MKHITYILGVFILILNCLINVEMKSADTSEKNIFIPTNEWQQVKADQVIPEGLHVRLNLQTGLKEAKLLENGDNSNSDLLQIYKDGKDESKLMTTQKTLTSEATEEYPSWKKKLMEKEIREALKNIKSDEPKLHKKMTADDLNEFRSYSELKKDFAKMNMQMRTDLEIMKELMEIWRNHSATNELSLERRIAILRDFEYYLHQVDNAVNFAQLGGIELLLEVLNSSLTTSSAATLHVEALLALGSAVQSNAKVQIRALEAGTLKALLLLLAEIQQRIEDKASSEMLTARVVYCLSALCRQFPLAQLRLLQLGGLEKLLHTGGSTRVRLKVLTLVYDLLIERKLAVEHNSTDRLQQYNKINLLEYLVEHGWCSIPTQLLLQCQPEDEDTREKALLAMQSLAPGCAVQWRQMGAPERDLLEGLVIHYRQNEMNGNTSNNVDEDNSAGKVALELAKEVRRDRDEL